MTITECGEEEHEEADCKIHVSGVDSAAYAKVLRAVCLGPEWRKRAVGDGSHYAGALYKRAIRNHDDVVSACSSGLPR